MPPARAASVVIVLAVAPALAAIGYGTYVVAGWGGLAVAGVAALLGLAQVFAEAVLTALASCILPKRKPPP